MRSYHIIYLHTKETEVLNRHKHILKAVDGHITSNILTSHPPNGFLSCFGLIQNVKYVTHNQKHMEVSSSSKLTCNVL